MSIGYIYSVVAFLSVLQLQLIFNRTIRTKYKETIDYPFCKLLSFFSIFCVVDALWGICDARGPFITPFRFTIVSYCYHTMSALSAFIWFGYIIRYLGLNGKIKAVCNIIRCVFIVLQLSMITSNGITGKAFSINEDLDYFMGDLRLWLYLAQYAYYVFILLLSTFFMLFGDRSRLRIYRNVFVFTLIPFLFGIGQYVFYNVAMYSMGFMLSAFIIYAYNLTDIRENYLAKMAEESSRHAVVDVMTELFNRRGYEEDLISYPSVPTEDDFVFVSMDLDGLKDVNDSLGHEAGDELIKGAAMCMKRVMGSYGRLYRVGGDEFFAIIYANSDRLEKIKNDFDTTVSRWKGRRVKTLHVSCGYVAKCDAPGKTVAEIAKLADEKMYRAKEEFYSTHGIDRRAQAEALRSMCKLYKKILKINITRDSYEIISMDTKEKIDSMGFSGKISEWFRDFGCSGQVHKDDLENYLRNTSIDYLRDTFSRGRMSVCIPYRRRTDFGFTSCIMEIIPASDYTNSNQTLFLYVKAL